ncbi:hypothetical protein DPMN_045248 [Dreissena polymorpha]|uniref:Uncharacterized protein n=1 Tax=Dreissena polymorpha TaxID=45954 RepID=A0A9D4HZG9_DREPO|nr:hypothetical protein DPMN_045248 [Dreissena polymorpha]
MWVEHEGGLSGWSMRAVYAGMVCGCDMTGGYVGGAYGWCIWAECESGVCEWSMMVGYVDKA